MGSFYGARLCRAGHEVHFLLRSDYEAVARDGVLIRSPDGDFVARPRCAKQPGQIGPADWVLVGLKTTANLALPELLGPLVGEQTRVITLQNGLGNEDVIARTVPRSRVYGGLCFVCLNRIAPGVVVHLAHGRVVMGAHAGEPDGALRGLAACFSDAGVPCEVAADLDEAHWRKLVWNIPFNGLGVAGAAGLEAVLAGGLGSSHGGSRRGGSAFGECLATDKLLSDPRWEALVRELMAETIAAAGLLGYNLPNGLAEAQIANTRSMGSYRASTLIDFERGLPLEIESLFLEPLRRARVVGAGTPRLAALAALLTEMDVARSREARDAKSTAD